MWNYPASNRINSALVFSRQIQIYWSVPRMEFELDEGHWLFPIFDFTR